jgi:hypothetical protein
MEVVSILACRDWRIIQYLILLAMYTVVRPQKAFMAFEMGIRFTI